jgi:hypothetical protein
MQGVATHKSALEDAQCELRRQPETSEEAWMTLFFRKEQQSPIAEKLLGVVGKKLDPQATCGIWKFDFEKAAGLQKPWRDRLGPMGA